MTGISQDCLKGIADRDGGGRITYDDGEVEIMSPGRRHEKHRHALAEFVEIACDSRGIDLVALGSTTLFGGDATRAIEPDEAFLLDPAKLARVGALDAAGEDDMTRYPSPDLVIEIDMRSPPRDRLKIYSAVGAVEVWEFDGETLVILRRNPRGIYKASARSGWLPVSATRLGDFVAGELPFMRAARQRAIREFVKGLIADQDAGR
jgi:Uma2 family endonuclease